MPQATKQLLSHMVLFSPLTVLFSPLTALWDVLLVDYHREIRRDSKPAVPVSVSCCRAMMLSTRVFNLEGGILLCTDSRSDKACISVPRQYQLTQASVISGADLSDIPCSGIRGSWLSGGLRV